jgi:hypothetical protein
MRVMTISQHVAFFADIINKKSSKRTYILRNRYNTCPINRHHDMIALNCRDRWEFRITRQTPVAWAKKVAGHPDGVFNAFTEV